MILLYDFLEKNKKLAISVIAIASAIVFFASAFSTLNDWVKLGIIVVDLGVSGTLLGKLSGQEQHYGMIIVRGVSGFKQMRFVAKHYGELSKKLADFGLSLGFGVFYGLRSFGASKKLLWHIAGMLLFYFIFLFQPTLASEGTLMAGIGFVAGLFGIGFYFLASHAYAILTIPATPPGVIPIVPGVTVPWEVVFALIIVAVVHELAHGVLCLVEKLQVKSSGVLLFGILPLGAFVEPDEEKLAKVPRFKQLRILVAGTTSNALFFILFLFVTLALSQAMPLLVQSVSVKSVLQNTTAFAQLAHGVTISSVDGTRVRTADDLQSSIQIGFADLQTSSGEKQVRLLQLEVAYSSNQALVKGTQILTIDGKAVYTADGLRNALAGKAAGSSVMVGTPSGEKAVLLNAQGKLGITLSARPTVEFQNDASNAFLFGLLSFLLLVSVYTFVLNFILASINLLPIFITDGQRIFLVELQNAFGEEKGAKMALAFGLITVGLMLVNALPWFK